MLRTSVCVFIECVCVVCLYYEYFIQAWWMIAAYICRTGSKMSTTCIKSSGRSEEVVFTATELSWDTVYAYIAMISTIRIYLQLIILEELRKPPISMVTCLTLVSLFSLVQQNCLSLGWSSYLQKTQINFWIFMHASKASAGVLLYCIRRKWWVINAWTRNVSLVVVASCFLIAWSFFGWIIKRFAITPPVNRLIRET